MNKILVSGNKKELMLDNSYYEFDTDNTYFFEGSYINKEVDLVILENTNIILNILGKNSNINLSIKLEKNSSLVINSFMIDGSTNINAVLEGEKAFFNLYNSILSNENSINRIVVNHKASYTNSLLRNHGFSLNGADLIFDVASYVPSDINGCTVKQDNKIIQEENSLSQINPKLYIDSYDVEASHAAYVGEFKENELFYLMSRGITLDDAKFLLLKSFLVGSMPLDDDVMQKFCNNVVKYFNREV